MPWTPKSTAPPTFDLAAAFLALISGDTTWSWLTGWVPLAPDTQFSTADFCSAGPVDAPPFTLSDFVGGGQRDGGKEIITGTALLGWKVAAAMSQRVFAAYCEMATTGISCVPAPNTDSGLYWQVNIPDGATYVYCEQGYGSIRAGFSNTFGDRSAGFGGGASVVPGGGTTASGSPNDAHINIVSGYAYLMMYNANGWAGVVNVCGNFTEPTDFTPTSQPEPPGLIPPTTLVYPDIASLGAELDRQELKLDAILALAQLLVSITAVTPQNNPLAAVPVTGGVGLDVTTAAGIIVAVDLIPPGADELFGPPATYKRLGKAIFNNASGVTAVVDLDSSPRVISPVPILSTHVTINVLPGATATVQLIPYP